MKKKYVTPMIAVEHYELTQSIANCAIKIGHYDSQCVLKDRDASWEMKDFAEMGWFSAGQCVEAADGMEGTDGICYHTSANIAFGS